MPPEGRKSLYPVSGSFKRYRARRELHRRYKRAMRDYREGRMTVFEMGAFLRSLDKERDA